MLGRPHTALLSKVRDSTLPLPDEATRESVDAKCRKLTAPWVRERALAAGGGRQSGTEAAAPAAAAGPSAGPSAAAPAAAPDSGDAAPEVPDIEVCGFFEGHSAAGNDAVLPPGVYTLHDLRQYGRKKGWCPYYLARHMVAYANVVVWSYQYMIDPKVSQMVCSNDRCAQAALVSLPCPLSVGTSGAW